MYTELVGTPHLGPWAETVFMSGLSLQFCKVYAGLGSRTFACRLESYRCTTSLTSKSRDFERIVAHGVT